MRQIGHTEASSSKPSKFKVFLDEDAKEWRILCGGRDTRFAHKRPGRRLLDSALKWHGGYCGSRTAVLNLVRVTNE